MDKIKYLSKNLYIYISNSIHTTINNTINDTKRGCCMDYILKTTSKVYKHVSESHKYLYDNNILEKQALKIKTISVGNITTGGTGKTPMVEFLSRLLLKNNILPCIITKGYGNDEKYQLYSKFDNCLFAVGNNRCEKAQHIIKKHDNKNETVAILDDGFQYWKLKRDIDIVMINAYDPWGGGHLLPRGRQREIPEQALKRADIVVIHNVTDRISETILNDIKVKIRKYSKKNTRIYNSNTIIDKLYKYENNKLVEKNIHELKEKNLFSICGIGSPLNFQHILEDNCFLKSLETNVFPDHYVFLENDVKILMKKKKNKEVIITEKDFYRCLHSDYKNNLLKNLQPYILTTKLNTNLEILSL